ncbi:hypothetical protein [Halomonas sp. LES1]|uniref:hypothetical protein n=1 Tax=Halomonas sp. LES1 TaxID=3075513 RepID=UPI002888A351|nr:hypothetical protein [Halomonas sp. LES1]MDT0512971.1 hypothetical protein [Halomonas sp. LES1]
MQECIPRPRLSAGLLLASLVAGNAQATTWSDTFIGYRHGTQFTEPGNPRDIEKHVLQFTHVSGYSLGQNFLNLDVLQSDSADPVSGGDSGATEAYLTYRHQLQLGKLTGEPAAFGPIKDVALTGGFDLNTKNTDFAPRKRLLVVGPTLKFDVPKGFVDLSLFYAHEWNHCGASFCDVNEIEFDPYYQINLAWGVPFVAGPLPLKFQGFYNYNGEKGEDYQGNDTDPEQLMRTSLMLDVGQLAWGEANQLWAGVGYEYWRNKFGNHGKDEVDTDAPTFQLEWHL